MKCEILIQHVAGVPGYEKIYLYFTKPKTGFERLFVSEFNKPRYIAGKEPKFSLYVGQPEAVFVEGTVARQWTPSYKRFSWQRFWQSLRAQNPSYQHECRCGVWSKSADAYTSHKRNCAVMREFKVFLSRVENTQTYKEALDAGIVKRKSKKPPKSKRKNDPQASAKLARVKRIAKAEKKIPRRRVNTK